MVHGLMDTITRTKRKSPLLLRKKNIHAVHHNKNDVIYHPVKCFWFIMQQFALVKYTQNLSSGFSTKRDPNQSLQLHRIARKVEFRL